MSTEDDTNNDAQDAADSTTTEAAAQPEALDATGAQPVGLGIADTLKASVAEYIAEHDVATEGGGQLNLDWNFIRDHGGPLMAHLFTSVTKQLLPENLNFSIPAAKKSAEAEGEADAKGEAKAKPGAVDVKFDLNDFIGKLFSGGASRGGDRDER